MPDENLRQRVVPPGYVECVYEDALLAIVQSSEPTSRAWELAAGALEEAMKARLAQMRDNVRELVARSRSL